MALSIQLNIPSLLPVTAPLPAPTKDSLKQEILSALTADIIDSSHIADLVKKLFKLNLAPSVLLEVINEIEETLAMRVQETPDSIYKSLLYRFIGEGFYDEALLLINLGVSSIHSCNDEGQTPLHLAAKHSIVPLVEALCKNKADPNATYTCSWGSTISPLSACLDEAFLKRSDLLKRVETCKILLANRADPAIGTIQRGTMTMLNCCLDLKMDEVAELILDRVDIHAKDHILQRTPLTVVTARCNHVWMKRLIDRKADVNHCSIVSLSDWECASKYSLLHITVKNQDVKGLLLLLEARANPNLKTPFASMRHDLTYEHLSPFEYAVERNARECSQAMTAFEKSHGVKIEASFTPRTRYDMNIDDLRKGFETTELRVKTELARACPVPDLPKPFRVYCRQKEDHPFIQRMFSELLKMDPDRHFLSNGSWEYRNRFNGAQRLCNPVILQLLRSFEKNSHLGVFFLNKEELPERGGCYNPDTGEELVMVLDNTSEVRSLGTLIHEAVHLKAHQKYGTRNCAPTEDPASHAKPTGAVIVDLEDFTPKTFKEAMDADLQYLKSTSYANCHGVVEMLIREGLLYDQLYIEGDMLARTGQAAALIGLKNPKMTEAEIEAILHRSIPNLFAYYKQQFLD